MSGERLRGLDRLAIEARIGSSAWLVEGAVRPCTPAEIACAKGIAIALESGGGALGAAQR